MKDLEWSFNLDTKSQKEYSYTQAVIHLHSIADKEGYVVSSLQSLADTWGWKHKQKVKRFLGKMEIAELCDLNVTTTLRLTNTVSVRKRKVVTEKVTQLAVIGDGKRTPEELEMWEGFKKWIDKFCPRVQQLPQPINIEEYFKLRKDFNKDEVAKHLKDMQNYKPLLTKYVSAYRTLRKWIKLNR